MTTPRRVVALAALTVLFMAALVYTATRANAASCADMVTRARLCHRIQVVGHRANEGPAAGTNENTLTALAVDRDHHAAFETDQWNLQDGTPVIHHDPDLCRTVDSNTIPDGFSCHAHARDLNLRQWRQLRTKGGEKLPTLRSWIIHAARWGVPGMVESKYTLTPVEAAKTAQLVRETAADVSFYAAPNVYAGGCHESAADALWRVGMTVGLKASGACPLSLQETAGRGYAYVITSASLLSRAYVREAHGLGLGVGDYLSSNRDTWAALVSARADYMLVRHVGPAVKWVS